MEAINIYLGLCKEKSYGVRDEYRMSGMAMEEILEDLSHSVLIATFHSDWQLDCSCELPPFCG